MNKRFALLLISSVLLGACSTEAPDTNDVDEEQTSDSSTEQLVDGTYQLEETHFGETGWKEGLTITVEDGKIQEAEWLSVNEDGLNKIEDDNYQETMTNTDGVGPQDFIPALEENLLDTQNPEDIDIVSGATGTSEKFIDYADILIDAAVNGEDNITYIDNGTEEDSEEATDEVNDEESEEAEEDAGNFSAVQ